MKSNQSDRDKGSSTLMASLGQGSDGGNKQLDFQDVLECAEWMEMLEIIIEAKGAVMVSRTSDGGALSFTFFVDNERVKRYVANREQWLALLSRLRR